ncbi:hypothetical protein WG901_15310 [Novosphingobium sp. PS1R-30]|uniref:Uncharacterized protein n=1 Tax=Novosphingobium anseongense TaxID=3133436 RepID=A0ABU8RYI2_9SPHN
MRARDRALTQHDVAAIAEDRRADRVVAMRQDLHLGQREVERGRAEARRPGQRRCSRSQDVKLVARAVEIAGLDQFVDQSVAGRAVHLQRGDQIGQRKGTAGIAGEKIEQGDNTLGA